ncbi:MAG: response regulator [Bacteroidales bacterium]|nr:response regulator [Bacteroidales bacterium]
MPSDFQISNSSILGVLLDSEQNLWLGTDGKGLIKYNTLTKKYKIYLADKTSPGALQDNVIRTIYEDIDHNIWIGTYKGGLSRYNKKSETFKTFIYNPKVPQSISYNDVVSIIEDNKKRLWVATNGGGLNLYNNNNESFTRFSTKDFITKTTICSDWLTCLFIDSKDNLWIGSFWGLSKFDPEEYRFKNYFNNADNPKSLSSNIVFSINEDKFGNIWVGTKMSLNKLNLQTDEFKHFGVKDGLPNNVVNSILTDDSSNLWLATNNGLARFNYESNEVKSFYYQDGLVSNEFIHNSSYKTPKGQFLLGSVFGFNSFFPDSIKDARYFPKVLITDFKIFNKSVPIGINKDGRTILEQSITVTKEIELNHYDNSFSFDFVALDYIHPEQILYSCKMEGFEENWNYLDHKRRFITYTNLDPGTYTFIVRASNKLEAWGDNDTRIIIQINPPLWKTGWAYLIYFIFAVGTGLFFWKLNFDRIKAKNQVRIERIKQAQVDQLNQSKLEFFTNISHEFRTPLTLIIGPIETLLENEKLGAQIKRSLSMMSRNAHRLLRLVNQLLDLRKIEKGKLKLQARQTDLIKFVSEIYESFEELAKRKNITFLLEKKTQELYMYFDHDKLDKILFNLLSNAFKFTPTNGTIGIKIIEELVEYENFSNGAVHILVKDNGRGMSPEHLEQIFERFYQSPEALGTIQRGTGIGLSLTKSLVEIHHGQISVESQKGEGSIFTIKLPLGHEHLAADEIIAPEISEPINADAQPVVLEGYENATFGYSNGEMAGETAPLILLVEDNEDVRTYIKNGLADKYRIAEAENGKEGIKSAHELMPDLIISDVMMPEMDGIAFCKKIKTELVSCHIPVILLTAKTSIEHRIEGLETGADSYIPKPFNPKHLLIRIEKLIELRQKLKEKFKNESDFEPINMAVTSTDERFLKKTIELIKLKIADTELGVENLGEEIGMSRSNLHRKLKSLVGQTPSEFIRTIRLKQAAHLLSSEDIPVSEIAYLVGFSSPSYFASCFHKLYSLTPTQYKEKHGEH